MNFDGLGAYASVFANGALQTLLLSASAVGLGLVLTVALFLIATTMPRRVAAAIGLVQEALRLCPPLVVLLFLFYGAPGMGLVLSPFVASTVALGVYFALFGADILRAAASTIPRALLDTEATLAPDRGRYVAGFMLPDLFRRTFPAMNAQVVSTLKNTSLASVVALPELTYAASLTATEVVRPFEIYALLAASYILTIAPIVLFLRHLERSPQIALEPVVA